MTRTNALTRAILELLAAKRFMCWRQNTGAFRTGNRFIRFGEPGIADILAVKDGRLYGIEVKTGRDKLSPAQCAWHHNLKLHGGVSIIARSIGDVLDVIDVAMIDAMEDR